MRRHLSLLLVLAMVVSLAVMGSGPPTAKGSPGLVTQDLTTGLTPTDLVNQLLGGGVAVSNVSFVGADWAAGTFSGGTGIVGFENGIILSSGNITGVIGPNTDGGWTQDNQLLGDADLQSLIPGYLTYDATVLEFDFVPSTSVLTFDYVFGSEEYNEFVNTDYNDVFGFFVNGVNQALIPGTSIPVSINNVNNGNPDGDPTPHNPLYYRNNDFQDGSAPIDTQLDGLTVVLPVTANVNAGVTNHIKLAIADAGDHILDSDVFIRAGSFVALPSVAFSSATYSVAENGGSVAVTVNLSGASTQAVTVNYATSNGTATAGSDYTATSGTLTFNPGETSKAFDVLILDDAVAEGDETVNLTLSSPVNATLGTPSTAVLTITDNDLPQFVSATIRIGIQTLNLHSEGVFTAFIKLPEGFNVADIDLATVQCEGAPAIKGVASGNTLVVKFERQSLVDVPTGDEVTLTVTGKLVDGTPFTGSDTTRVIDKGGKR